MSKAIKNWNEFKDAGDTDDDRLDAYLSYAAAQTYEPTLFLDQLGSEIVLTRKHALTQGFSILGPRVADQRRSGNPVSHVIKLRTAGGAFYLQDNQTFSAAFEKLTLDGTASSWLIDGHPSRVLWTSTLRDITCVNAAGLLGSPDQKLLVTVLNMDGYFNLNNVQRSAFHIGGSDNTLNFTNALIDCPPSLHSPTEPLIKFSSLSKTTVSGLYVTAQQHPAMSISGGGGLVFDSGNRFEGRNENEPSDDALIKITSGDPTFRGCWFAYGMANPTSGKGLVHATGGNVLIDGAYTDQAAGVNAPLFYASAGSHRVVNAKPVNGQRPIVHQATPGLIDVDNSVILQTG